MSNPKRNLGLVSILAPFSSAPQQNQSPAQKTGSVLRQQTNPQRLSQGAPAASSSTSPDVQTATQPQRRLSLGATAASSTSPAEQTDSLSRTPPRRLSAAPESQGEAPSVSSISPVPPLAPRRLSSSGVAQPDHQSSNVTSFMHLFPPPNLRSLQPNPLTRQSLPLTSTNSSLTESYLPNSVAPPSFERPLSSRFPPRLTKNYERFEKVSGHESPEIELVPSNKTENGAENQEHIEREIANYVYKEIKKLIDDSKVDQTLKIANKVYNILLEQIQLITKNIVTTNDQTNDKTNGKNKKNGTNNKNDDADIKKSLNKPSSEQTRNLSNSISNLGNRAYDAMRNMFGSNNSSRPGTGQNGGPSTKTTPEFTENYKKFLDDNNVVQIEISTKEPNKDGTVVVKSLGLFALKDLGESFYKMKEESSSADNNEFESPMQMPVMPPK